MTTETATPQTFAGPNGKAAALTVGQIAELRKPFPAEAVGKLPRVTCKDCSDRNCKKTEHKPARCNDCGGYLTPAHIHLDYVGHAEVTDRLLSVDPLWNWEPLATTAEGLPLVSQGASGERELWIKLTVCGITRLGVGSVAAKSWDAEKQLIGDALRNAAMRFGVALDLWAKEDLESQLADGEQQPAKKAPAKAQGAAKKAQPPEPEREAEQPSAPRSTATRRPPPTATPERPSPALASDAQRVALRERINAVPAEGGWRDALQKHWTAKGIASIKQPERFTTDDAEKAAKLLTEIEESIRLEQQATPPPQYAPGEEPFTDE